jgi:hypothetical protein
MVWKEQIEKHPQPVGDLAPNSTTAIGQVSFSIPISKIAKAPREADISLMDWYQAAG